MKRLEDTQYRQLCGSLRQEAAEQVERIGLNLVALERQQADEPRDEAVLVPERDRLLDDSFRQAHNLKGAAGSLGFGLTAKLAHAIESVLAALRRGELARVTDGFDALHEGLVAVPHALAVDPGAEAEPVVDKAIAVLEAAVKEEPAEAGAAAAAAALGSGAGAGPARVVTQVGPVVQGAGPGAGAGTGAGAGAGAGTGAGTGVGKAPKGKDGQIPRAAVGPAAAGGGEETLRVSTRKLGALMAQVGELLAARLRTDQRLAELRGVLASEQARLERRTALRAAVRDESPVPLDRRGQRLVEALGEGVDHQKELVRQLRELVRAFEADALQSTILSGELQENIRRIQTFPLASVLEPLPRALRQMARADGKQAELAIEGAELELDKKVLDELRDPLYHLLRNALDHGVESPAARAAAGKPPRATIRIRAEHRGDAIMITMSDDGPGVDLDGVARAAVAQGVITAAQAAEMAEPRLLELIFATGLTTRSEATGLSGRGIGLDVVRTNVERLRGTVHVESRPGAGFSVSIVLPLTIYVVHALVIRVGEHKLALPISAIQRILRVSAAEVLEVEQTNAVVVDGRPVVLVQLASLLGVRGDERRPDRMPVIVIGAGEARCAIVADDIVADQTLLAKNLEPPLVRIRHIAGATILGDGSVVLMLNPIDLLRSASVGDPEAWRLASLERPKPARLLLADDSLTTRALERSVLELAGFEVVAVANGDEALSALERERFDVVVSDVSMPRVDGLQLAVRIRADLRHRTLPIVLVTSLGSDDDRRRGLEAGADAYIVKSEFDHEKLVQTVNTLLGRG